MYHNQITVEPKLWSKDMKLYPASAREGRIVANIKPYYDSEHVPRQARSNLFSLFRDTCRLYIVYLRGKYNDQQRFELLNFIVKYYCFGKIK